MQRNDFPVRAMAMAMAIAVIIVAGAMLALARTSNANFRTALANAEQRNDVAPVRVVIEPSRIDVVGLRAVTRTAERDDKSLPRS